ncbi:MAG: hypothetical protein KME50_29960 [Nostoc desertorum CM1-VF14]|jgi:hypothetical protein|nr:hypothetical protein [Nostoc desertorum CM1-VF14]
MISNLISHQSNHNSSPFNTIRHLDDNGNEHWLARVRWLPEIVKVISQ